MQIAYATVARNTRKGTKTDRLVDQPVLKRITSPSYHPPVSLVDDDDDDVEDDEEGTYS